MSNLRLPTINGWHGAARILGNKDERKIGYQTWLVRVAPFTIAVRHFNTQILTFVCDRDAGRSYTVYTPRGYHTRTTTHRLHHFSPQGVRVFTKDFTVYVQDRSGAVRPLSDGLAVDVIDGIFIPTGA